MNASLVVFAMLLAAGSGTPPAGSVSAPDPPLVTGWQTLTKADGLPADKILCLHVRDDTVWAGTEHGLARIREGRVEEVISTDDGLAHRVVMGIASSPDGDLWVATMGGLTQLSGGRARSFTQFDSGLPNDVLFGVAWCGREVWVATTSGLGRLDTWTGRWRIYNERNAPMHEIWGYHVTCAHPDYVYAAVWGGGVLEMDRRTERWKDYVDPDGEMEIDLFRDDGLIHVITTSVDWSEGLLWASTYFGLSIYDGRHWRGFMDHDSGLAGNFVNHVRAQGKAAWISTDRGLSWFDGTTWVRYRRAPDGRGGEVRIGWGDGARFRRTDSAIAHDFVFAADYQGDTIWVATGKGLSRGTLAPAGR